MNRRALLFALAAGLAAALAGCANRTPPAVLLTLPPTAAEANAAVPAVGTPKVLVVRRVEIPEYLQTRRVRYRTQASTLAEWPDALWAERLEVGLTRELAGALRNALPGWTICEASCPESAPELSLSLQLRPFDFVRPRGELQAEARWVIAALQPTPHVVESDRHRHAVGADADTPQAHAQAISELLQALARRVADRVRAEP